MNSFSEAVKLALEKGGYDPVYPNNDMLFVLDPLFWIALGKALNWGEHIVDCNWTKADCEYKATHHYCPHPEHECNCNGNVEWKLVAQRYFKLRMENGNEEQFFNELLKGKI